LNIIFNILERKTSETASLKNITNETTLQQENIDENDTKQSRISKRLSTRQSLEEFLADKEDDVSKVVPENFESIPQENNPEKFSKYPAFRKIQVYNNLNVSENCQKKSKKYFIG